MVCTEWLFRSSFSSLGEEEEGNVCECVCVCWCESGAVVRGAGLISAVFVSVNSSPPPPPPPPQTSPHPAPPPPSQCPTKAFAIVFNVIRRQPSFHRIGNKLCADRHIAMQSKLV